VFHWIQTCIFFQNIVTMLVSLELLCSGSLVAGFRVMLTCMVSKHTFWKLPVP